MFIIHFGFVVFMAINAFKNSKVRAVYMAIAAGIPFVFVFSGIDGKILGIMIPGGFIPPIGIVTVFAVCGKTRCLVIGVGGIVVIGFVATVAIRRCSGIPVGVAILALDGFVRPGKWKVRLVMVEGCRLPGIGRMAGFAVGREARCLVIRIGSAFVIALMATVAIGGCSGIPICVAGLAFQLLMGSGQWEIGIIMIKRCGSPALVGMTLGTIVIKIPADMIGICCIAVIVCMAAKAIPRQATGLIIDMALNTPDVCMGAFQRKSTPL